MRPIILYHGNCPDGTGAALAAWLKYQEDADYQAVNYGQSLPQIPEGQPVFIVDFSYPREVLERLQDTNPLVVLDHHATAQKDLEGLLCATFDMDKSGAVLSWEYFHPSDPVPEFFLYLQDRDLWRFALKMSREVSMALRSYPMDFKVWEDMWRDVEKLKVEGVACRRLTEQQVDNMAKNFRWGYFDMRGEPEIYFSSIDAKTRPHIGDGSLYVVPVANATVFFSEVGEKLLEQWPNAPFSAYYLDRSDGKRQWGMRSRADFDCSVVAKSFGGGGHKQASGFIQKI